MLSVLWAFIPKRYLYGAAAIAALVLGSYAALAAHNHALKAQYFDKGAAFVRDSAVEATILRLAVQHKADSARADSTYRVAQQSSAPLAAAAQRFDSAPRHTPRIEALSATTAMPVVPLDSLVGVTVENTGEHFILPRRAAQYWATADSLVGVAAKLLAKYAAANKAWSQAWSDEHNARIGADSLVAMYAERLRNATALPPQSHAKRDVVYATIGAVVALVARNQIHR